MVTAKGHLQRSRSSVTVTLVVELSVPVLHPLREHDVPVCHVEECEEQWQHELCGRLKDGREALLVRTREMEHEGELGQLDKDEEHAGEHPHVQVGDVAHLKYKWEGVSYNEDVRKRLSI